MRVLGSEVARASWRQSARLCETRRNGRSSLVHSVPTDHQQHARITDQRCPHLARASRRALPEVIGTRRCVRVLKSTAKRYLDSNDELLIHPQQALRRPRRHAVERTLIGIAVLGPRCSPTLLPAHLLGLSKARVHDQSLPPSKRLAAAWFQALTYCQVQEPCRPLRREAEEDWRR
jgi:hypothetical protein